MAVSGGQWWSLLGMQWTWSRLNCGLGQSLKVSEDLGVSYVNVGSLECYRAAVGTNRKLGSAKDLDVSG